MGAGSNADPIYVMGRTPHETLRLMRQAQLYSPFTRQLFVDAGVGPGMRVLDLGSGAGDVALLAAELVGPHGAVVGVDTDAAILETAHARVAAMGLDTVTFRHEDSRTLPADQPFDAVVSRFFLPFQRDLAAVLHHAARHLRPGGVVVCQEHDWIGAAVAVPASPLLDQCRDWVHRVSARAGTDLMAIYRLPGLCPDAGLAPPQLRYDAPISADPAWFGYDYAAELLRSILPSLEGFGIATAADVGVDTFAARLRAEVGEHGGILRGLPVIGAWARKL